MAHQPLQHVRLYLTLAGQAAHAWFNDRGPSMGAALAFYSAFSLAPLLLIVINIAAIAFGSEQARAVVVDEFRSLIGPVGGDAIDGMLRAAAQFGTKPFSLVLSVIVLFIGATTVLVELQDDLDKIWEAPTRASVGLLSVLRARVLSFALILGFGFLFLVSLIASSALAMLRKYWGTLPPETWVPSIDFVLSLCVFTALFAILYKWLPRVKIKWADVWVGAATTSALFNLGNIAIGAYLGRAAGASIYAAAASFAVLLLWLYYSAQIFLLGAEFTWVRARYRRGASGVAHDKTSAQPASAVGGGADPTMVSDLS